MLVKKAEATHIEGIRALMAPYVQQGIVLERSIEEIKNEIDCFWVAINNINNIIIGVVSYHDYDNGLFEVRSLIVDEASKHKAVGTALVKHVISFLKNNDPQARIFALTYVPQFFEKLNFERIDKNNLPEKIWKDCYKCPRKDNCVEIALTYRG